ncbi:SGNH/GDSL hydrolase family protein [Acinetobacter proteolyticus]|nr:SGNH/GDSL hydrolase family protein [Acinetobacter proteolyticus]WEI17155.1 SGNH/GDSL hydrolase family protein [Acinetobacter proteolyticus]
MADQIITKEGLVNASKDANSLEVFMSGSDIEDVVTRLGKVYPTLAKLVRMLMETGGWKAYETESALKATTPIIVPSVAYAFDTKKLYLWNGAIWVDEGLSQLAQAQNYVDTLMNAPFIAFTSSISVDSNGVITLPIFTASKRTEPVKQYSTTFEYTPASTSTIYYLYYRFSTNEILTGTVRRKEDGDLAFIGIAFQGRFASQYAVKYKTDTNVIPKLLNEVINSRLNPNLPYDFIYQWANQGNADFSPVVTVNDVQLSNVGIKYAQKTDAALNNRGAFAQVMMFDRKLRGPLRCSFSFLVHDPSGAFNFGTSGGPIIYCQKLNANGSSVANFLTINAVDFSYTELSANTRLYYRNHNSINLSQTTYPDSYISSFIIGLRVGSDAPNPIHVSGYWFSYTDDLKGYRYPISIADTHYPYYERVSPITVLEHYYKNQVSNNTKVNDLTARVGALESIVTVNPVLLNLKKTLSDPFHSVYVRLIGDSITWGVGATNSSPSEPRNHSLSDPRNNLQCKSWANLLRDYLGKRYVNIDAAVTEDAPGSGYYEKEFTVDISDTSLFQYIERTTENGITPVFSNDTTSYFNKTFRLSATNNSNGRLKFKFVGSKFRLMYTAQPATTNNFIDVYANGTLVGSFDYSTGSGSQLYTAYVDLPFGTYDIVVMNRSTDGGVLRLEGVSSVKRIKVSNDGISGTGSWEWVPGTPLYNGSIQTADEFVFVMLGTNDKGDTTRPPNNEVKTYNFVKQIVAHLKTRSKNVIVMAANAVTNSESALNYTQADTAVQMKKLSSEQATAFVDHYKATLPLKLQGESFLADGLHPNDLGYRKMFESIIDILEI